MHTTAPIILDIGCGEGAYSDIARGYRPEARWIGLEVYLPYVEQFELIRKYDEVVVADAREYVFPREPFVLLAGDVIEHMSRVDGARFLARARAAAEEIMVSVPIVHWPQDGHDGNDHEAHLHDWSFEEMQRQLPGCEVWRGNVLGRYWWRKHASA